MTARTTTGAVTTVRARRTTTLLAAALLPLTLAACGVGQDPQTYRQRSTQDATNADVRELALRDVAIQPPGAGTKELAAGSDALASLTIVSTAGQPDRLLSVSSPAAASVDLVDGTGHVLPSEQIPGQGSIGASDFGLVLRGLSAALRPGMYVAMTFVFERNGSTTLQVPVKVYDNPLPRDSFSPQPATEG